MSSVPISPWQSILVIYSLRMCISDMDTKLVPSSIIGHLILNLYLNWQTQTQGICIDEMLQIISSHHLS